MTEPAAPAPVPFSDTQDPVLRSVSRWLDEVTDDVPAAVRSLGELATIAWIVGPPRDTPTRVLPRF